MGGEFEGDFLALDFFPGEAEVAVLACAGAFADGQRGQREGAGGPGGNGGEGQSAGKMLGDERGWEGLVGGGGQFVFKQFG